MFLFRIATMSAEEAESFSDICIVIAVIGGLLLIVGLIGEFFECRWWKKSFWYKAAKIAVIVGVLGELLADTAIFRAAEREQKITDDSIESSLKVQKAMLDQLKARGFTREQFNGLVASLKGKIKNVSVYTLTDTEAFFFGQAIIQALQKAGANVGWMVPSAPLEEFLVQGISSTGVTLYVSQETPGFKELVETFFSAFSKAGVAGLGSMTPVKSLPNIPSPAIFVAKHEVPFMQSPEYEFPASIKFPPPPWQSKP